MHRTGHNGVDLAVLFEVQRAIQVFPDTGSVTPLTTQSMETDGIAIGISGGTRGEYIIGRSSVRA